MFTRPRHSHEPIPSISTLSLYPSPHHILNKSHDLTWYTSPDTYLRQDPITHLPPPPLPPITRRITKPKSCHHLPAEKNAALRAAKIARDCKDLGPHTRERFRCSFPACKKTFQRRYNFKVHARKHTKETPYTCSHPACGKKFRWRSSMSHHLKAHEKRDAQRNATHSAAPHIPFKGGEHVRTEHVLLKIEDTPRRLVQHAHLPTSPISSATNDRFQGFGLEHVPLNSADVGMDELQFHPEHVNGIMFDNIM